MLPQIGQRIPKALVLLLLATTASASEPSPTIILPTAAPVSAGGTAGVTVRIGDEHRIRVGIEGYFAPGVEYTFVRPRWFVGGGIRVHALTVPEAHGTVGLRW